MKNVFIVRMSNPGFEEYALKESKIVIGWAKLVTLKNTRDSEDASKQRENIRQCLRTSGWYKSERAVGNVAGAIDRFLYAIRDNDYIIFPVEKGFYLGIVNARGNFQAQYDEEQAEFDRSWYWDVLWNMDECNNPKKYSREILTAKLHYSLKTQHTCIQLDKGIVNELEESISRKYGIDLNQKILDKEYSYLKTIKHALQNYLNENTFEDFIIKILMKEGALKVNKLSKNSALKGDVDIDAVFGVNCAGNNKKDEFIYGYQCKHHRGETDKSPIKQLIERVKDQDCSISYQKLFAVTTGNFSTDAIEYAKEFNSKYEGEYPEIVLIDGIELSKWLVELGLDGLEIY